MIKKKIEYENLYVTSLFRSFNYGYFYSIQFTFLRPSKAVENRRKAQNAVMQHTSVPYNYMYNYIYMLHCPTKTRQVTS